MAITAAAPADVARADDVNITAGTNNGINLDTFAGTTAQVASGVTVTDATLAVNCATFAAICATAHAWTLTNNGTIGPSNFNTGVYFTAGGSVVNYGSISGGGGGANNAIWIQGGTSVSVDNKLGATADGAIVIGEMAPVAGTVTNAGTINDSAMVLASGGTVTNLATGVIIGHNSIAVAVTQGTSRIVDNYGLIQSNDTGFDTGVSLESGKLTNYLGGRILGAYNAVWANGSGATSITNDGYLEASKAQGGGSAIEVDHGGNVVNSGTIKSLTSDATTTDAGISFTGAGSITNSGTIMSATGGLAIMFNDNSAHTLTLDTGSILGGNVQGGTGTDGLILKGIGTESINKFLAFETLSMQGTEWNLLGNGTFATSAAIQSGILHVNGQLTSPTLTVQSGGTLSGTGTIVGAVNITGGTLAPGNSIGTLTVQGSLVFTAAASYLVEISPTSADRTNIVAGGPGTGSATLGGATVNASFASGSYVAKRYTILNAASGVTGTFGSLNNSNLPGGFLSSLSYDNNNVYLNLALDLTPKTPTLPTGLNVNQRNVATGLTDFFNTTGGIPMVFGGLTPYGLTIVSGELPTASQQATFDGMNLFLGLLTDPFVAGRGDPLSPSGGAPQFADDRYGASAYASKDKPRSQSERDAYAAMYRKAPTTADPFAQRWSVWAAGHGGSQTTAGNIGLGSNAATSSVYGTAVGADYRFSPNTLAGFALAGGGTNFSLANGLGSGRSDLFQAGAFIRHTAGPAYVSGALAYGWQYITTDRTVNIAGADRLHAAFNANAFSGRVESGYRFVTPWMAMGVAPYAAGQFTAFDLPAYAEQVLSGANTFALAYASKSVTDARSELGVRTDKSYALQNAILILRERFAWAHEFNPDRTIAATFQTLPGASFIVNGAARAHDAALTTASAEMKWPSGFSLVATFEGAFSAVTQSYAGKGVARYQW